MEEVNEQPRSCKSHWWCHRHNWFRISWLGIPVSIVVLVIVVVLGILASLLAIPQTILMLIVGAFSGRYFNLVVEHAYMLPLGKYHVSVSRWMLKKSAGLKHHSRFVDVRTDVPLQGGKKCTVHAIPCLTDNISYLVTNESTKESKGYVAACIIDPSDAKSIIPALKEISRIHYSNSEIKIEAILTTHKHWDHQGGTMELLKTYPSIKRVYGSFLDDVIGCTDKIRGGDTIKVADLEWKAIAAPGHTKGSLMFFLKGKDESDILMTGDTLFCGGCGANFEGTDEDRIRNMATIVDVCSKQSLLFPGHEYTTMLLQEQLGGPSWGKMPPAQFFRFMGLYFNAIHRRALRKQDKLLTIPIRLEDEMLLNPNLRALQKHHRTVLRLVQLALKDFKANVEPDTAQSETDTVTTSLDTTDSVSAPITPSTESSTEKETSTIEKIEENAIVSIDQANVDVQVEQKPVVHYNLSNPICVNTHETIVNPFTTIYTADFNAVKLQLQSGVINGQQAAMLLDQCVSRMKIGLDTSGHDFNSEYIPRKKQPKDTTVINVEKPVEQKRSHKHFLQHIDFKRVHKSLTTLAIAPYETKFKGITAPEPLVSRKRLENILNHMNPSNDTINFSALWPEAESIAEVSVSRAIFFLSGSPNLEDVVASINASETDGEKVVQEMQSQAIQSQAIQSQESKKSKDSFLSKIISKCKSCFTWVTCCCRRKPKEVLKWFPETTHALHACPLCSKTFSKLD